MLTGVTLDNVERQLGLLNAYRQELAPRVASKRIDELIDCISEILDDQKLHPHLSTIVRCHFAIDTIASLQSYFFTIPKVQSAFQAARGIMGRACA